MRSSGRHGGGGGGSRLHEEHRDERQHVEEPPSRSAAAAALLRPCASRATTCVGVWRKPQAQLSAKHGPKAGATVRLGRGGD